MMRDIIILTREDIIIACACFFVSGLWLGFVSGSMMVLWLRGKATP
jgi:hypothetical protein